MRFAIPLVALCLALVAFETQARAQAAATCTVTEMVATNDGKGVDPKLSRFERKLKKPPFSSWDTFRLLAEKTFDTEEDKPVTTGLAPGGKLTLLLKDKIPSGGKVRLRYGLDMDSKAGKRILSTTVAFDSGDAVLVAGEPYQKGTYILALSCRAK